MKLYVFHYDHFHIFLHEEQGQSADPSNFGYLRTTRSPTVPSALPLNRPRNSYKMFDAGSLEHSFDTVFKQ